MTDLRPSEREGKPAKKASTTSTFFRFLSKKSLSPQNVNPNESLNTARQISASESKKSIPIQQPPSFSRQSNIPASSASLVANGGFTQRKAAIPQPSIQNQQTNARIENLKCSTPPNFDLPPIYEVRSCGSETGTDPLETINSKIKDVLYKNGNERWTNFWTVIEEATQVKRENIAYVLVGICAILSVWSTLGDSVSIFVGFAYPSIATYKILNPSPRSPPISTAETFHWFRYWSIFAFIQCIDVVFGKLFSVLPLYQICKVLIFLATQYSHWNVSGFVYSYAVMPVVKWIKKFCDKYVFNKSK
uniref:Receptor expression-enhancing protein n=1 Tax=Panagrolaimus sp. PS1159 TaxID=55785 RepID=A0AC35F3H9_9BILA